jgi:molybdopterin-containing oxidoreductase family iron-sulfur binding subunit
MIDDGFGSERSSACTTGALVFGDVNGDKVTALAKIKRTYNVLDY